MKISDSEYIKSSLTMSSMFLTGHELLKNLIIEKLKGFLCRDSKLTAEGNLVFTESEEYIKLKTKIHPGHSKKSNEYYSCCKWYLDNNIITESEFDDIQKINSHRNKITHNLPVFLLDDSLDFDIDLFNKIEILITKISKYWILEFDIPTNSDFDNLDINTIEIVPTVVSLMSYLNEITKNEYNKIKNLKHE